MLSSEDLRNWLAERSGLDLASISDEMPIFSGGALDSFDLVELVAFVETANAVRIQPIDINMRNFDSVAKVLAFLQRLASPVR